MSINKNKLNKTVEEIVVGSKTSYVPMSSNFTQFEKYLKMIWLHYSNELQKSLTKTI